MQDSGIAKCIDCGSPMHVFHKGAKGVLSGYMRCHSARKGVCKAKQIRLDYTEEVFKEMLAKLNILALVQDGSAAIAAQLEVVTGRLIAERKRLAGFAADYAEQPSPTIRNLIYSTETTITGLEADESRLHADLAADKIIDKEDFFSRLDLESYAGRGRANGILKRLKIQVFIDTTGSRYGVDRDGVRILDMIDSRPHGVRFYPVSRDMQGAVQTQDGTFTPALIDMDDYGDEDDHDGYDATDNPIPAH